MEQANTPQLLQNIKDSILHELSRKLQRSGIMYRIFGRAKTVHSLEHKMQQKGDKYLSGEKKIQDVIGIRVVLYFSEDVEAVEMFLCGKQLVDRSADELDAQTFKPKRLNLVEQLPDELVEDFRKSLPEKYAQYIDDTYEIQIRTVFSEGWHEVEHDLRYKCKEDWDGCENYARQLNGVFATLETAQWSMSSIFHQISKQNMMQHNYKAMLRNQMLLRFEDDDLSENLKTYFDSHLDLLDKIRHTERLVFVLTLLNAKVPIRLTYDNAVFLINRIDVLDKGIIELESEEFKEIFSKLQ